MKLINRNMVPDSELPVKVLQFGEGNFLRAFVDWIIDRMNKTSDFNAGVSVVQPIDRGLIHLLQEQDHLYTLYLKGIRDGKVLSEHEIISCIQRSINPYSDLDMYLAEAENPDLRFIISNTTEAGIAYDANDRPDKGTPNTFPAKLAILLYNRFRHFEGAADKGFIIIPCELIESNGDNLKKIILQYADDWGWEPAFAEWLESSNTFCNTLVDRIVPGYPKDRIHAIWEELGYKDNLVVEGEQFHLWVIEAPESVQKEFPADEAGLNVVFTDDQTPYRTRKVRILNGAHTSMVPVGILYGMETVRESVEDEVMGAWINKTIFEEIVPTLDLPQEELEKFANDVLDRFRNPFIKHYLISIALNSTSKFKTRALPSLLEYQKRKGSLPKRLVLALAALIRFYKGTWVGNEIPLKDDADMLEFFSGLWNDFDTGKINREELVEKVLANKSIWKQDLNKVDGLHALTVASLTEVHEGRLEELLKDQA
ncbi:MAG: tagaturonate reductase [Bacteroidetes bacterium]|nr:tagaturonate reductase [Bacteroidota bacterium]